MVEIVHKQNRLECRSNQNIH